MTCSPETQSNLSDFIPCDTEYEEGIIWI
jgi:hypothetical protein